MVDVVLGLELLNAGRNPFELVVRWVAALPADHPLVKSTSPRAAPRASPRASGAPALPPIRDSASAAAKRRERDVVFSEEKQVTTPQAMAWLAATELVFRPWLRVYNAVLKGTPIYLWCVALGRLPHESLQRIFFLTHRLSLSLSFSFSLSLSLSLSPTPSPLCHLPLYPPPPPPLHQAIKSRLRR